MPECGWVDTISNNLASIIENELKVTVGCTDPVAIALATASAASVYLEKSKISSLINSVLSISLELDMNIYKNAFAVGVPGTGMKGIPIAAILGLLIHDTSKGLMIFNDPDIELINQAIGLMSTLPVQIKVIDKPGNLYIQSKVTWKDGTVTASAISDYHDNIIWSEIDGIRTPVAGSNFKDSSIDELELHSESLIWMTEHIRLVSDRVLEKITDGIEINMKASETGLSGDNNNSEQVLFEHNPESAPDNIIITELRARVSAATRLRMKGGVLPIMACGGSGNHGITFFITMNLGWRMKGILPEYSVLQAAALGIFLLHIIKSKTGILTPMCGCSVASGMAASAALAWGMSGDSEIMLHAMNLVFCSLGGVVCDGAKPACEYKTSLSSQVAIESARMAVSGITIPFDEGLSSGSFTVLLKNLQKIHKEGMSNFNSSIVSILQSKL